MNDIDKLFLEFKDKDVVRILDSLQYDLSTLHGDAKTNHERDKLRHTFIADMALVRRYKCKTFAELMNIDKDICRNIFKNIIEAKIVFKVEP